VSEQNRSIARKFIEGAWNQGDMSVVTRLVAPTHVPHGPFAEQFPGGAKGAAAFVTSFLTAFPDLKATIVKQEAEGDQVETTLTFTGTHTGPLMDIPATGKQVTAQMVITDRFVGGMIVETWSEWSPEAMFRQLGVTQTVK
jgi:steroid delta-isomerase-like uncharacterized protein